MESKTLSIKDAAKYIGVHYRYIAHLISEKKLKAINISRGNERNYYRISINELNKHFNINEDDNDNRLVRIDNNSGVIKTFTEDKMKEFINNKKR